MLHNDQAQLPYSTVIFDLDGTLLNTLPDLTACLNHVLAAHAYPLHSQEAVRGFVGNGLRMLITRALPPKVNEADFQRVYEEFRSYYTEHCQELTQPYAGVIPLVRELRCRGVKLAIHTNKEQEATERLRERFFSAEIGKKAAVGRRDGLRVKPWPDGVFVALEAVGGGIERAVYVGDSEVDIATAAQAGLECVSVTWGFRDRDFLLSQGAARLADSPQELLSMLI